MLSKVIGYRSCTDRSAHGHDTHLEKECETCLCCSLRALSIESPNSLSFSLDPNPDIGHAFAADITLERDSATVLNITKPVSDIILTSSASVMCIAPLRTVTLTAQVTYQKSTSTMKQCQGVRFSGVTHIIGRTRETLVNLCSVPRCSFDFCVHSDRVETLRFLHTYSQVEHLMSHMLSFSKVSSEMLLPEKNPRRPNSPLNPRDQDLSSTGPIGPFLHRSCKNWGPDSAICQRRQTAR